MPAWLTDSAGALENAEQAFIDGLANLLDALDLPALDTPSCGVVCVNGVHITLAHLDGQRTIQISLADEIVVSYGLEHDHFAWEDVEPAPGRPFSGTDSTSRALSFIRDLITGRIELRVTRRPFFVSTVSYRVDDDGELHRFLRGGTVGPFFGWKREPEIHRFDFTSLPGSERQ